MLLSRDFPTLDAADVRVVLLEASNRLLAALPPDLSASTLTALEQKRVIVRFETAVEDFNGSQVTLKGGEILDSYTMIWAAGVRAHPLAQQLGLPVGSQGRVKVLPTLQLPGHPEVYVIGDAAYLEDTGGKPLPMVAPVAMQQAGIATGNILRSLHREQLEKFIYKDPGSLATIGRNQAVAYIGGLKFRGFLAWVVWLVVHIMQLIGFRNRLIVLINWAWDYFLYERAVRVIEPAGKKG
jgi:NADH:ubiquinone reductase (H+-translocating)